MALHRLSDKDILLAMRQIYPSDIYAYTNVSFQTFIVVDFMTVTSTTESTDVAGIVLT